MIGGLMPPKSFSGGDTVETKKINVTKPFTYYIDGCRRRDFEIGEHEVPYDCAAYAEQYGYTKRPPEVKANADSGASHARRSKAPTEGGV